jgi:hypothetical protein
LRNRNRVQGSFRQTHFSDLGTFQMEPEWQTIAIDDHHPLRALPFPGEADFAPTLLGRNKRAIEESDTPIKLTSAVEGDSCRSPDALPNPGFAPAFQATPDDGWTAIVTAQILPAAARS